MLVKLTFLQKTNMEGDSEDATSQRLLNIEAETSQSLLNTRYDQLIGRGDENSSDTEDYGLTSYQQPPPQERLRKNEAKKKDLKRKASEVPTTTTAKIKKTEDSIKLLKNHLERNTCPKPLRYSARANIPADEQFKKDIKAIKQKAERGFVEALTKFHYRRLEKQKQKLHKEMSLANGKGRKDTKNVNVSTTEDRNEIKALALKLKEQYEYLLSKLNSDTKNKNCEKYSQMSVKCVNDTVGGSNKITGKSFSRKIQRKTATRKERRKESVIKLLKGENILRTSQTEN